MIKDARHRRRPALAMEIDGAHQQRIDFVSRGIADGFSYFGCLGD
jgi:hypothetical protein